MASAMTHESQSKMAGSGQHEINDVRHSVGDDGSTPSTGSSLGFQILNDSTGNRAECLVCERVIVNRGISRAVHRKKCHLPKQKKEEKDLALPPLAPTRTPTKRRSQVDDLGSPGKIATPSDVPCRLRSGKKYRAELSVSPGNSTSNNQADSTRTTTATEASLVAIACAQPPSQNDDPLEQFDLVHDLTRMACKHCKIELGVQLENAQKHLQVCDAYKAAASRDPDTCATAEQAKKRAPADSHVSTTSLHGHGAAATSQTAIHSAWGFSEQPTVAVVLSMDANTRRAWIFGSRENAEEMQRHYHDSPIAVHGPAVRFLAVSGVLADLDVAQLLGQLPNSTKFTAMISGLHMMPLLSASEAWEKYGWGCPIAFRPPDAVAELFVSRLAADLHDTSMIPARLHDVKLICAQNAFAWDWQFHTTHMVVVSLRGNFRWKMKRSSVTAPTECFHPRTHTTDLEELVAVQLASAIHGTGVADMGPPRNDTKDGMGRTGNAPASVTTPPESPGQQVMVDAGSVIYMPPGTWYQATGLENSANLLVIQLKSIDAGSFLVEAARRLAAQRKWQDRVHQAFGGDKATRKQRAGQLIRDFFEECQGLEPNEVVPELLLESDDVEPSQVKCEQDGERYTKSYEVDLADWRGFRGAKTKPDLHGSLFRVSSMAQLMRMDELLQLGNKAQQSSASSLALAGAGMASTDASFSSSNWQPEDTFVMRWGFGKTVCRARLRVQFHCSPLQRKLVDWIRSCHCQNAIHISVLTKVMAHFQDGIADVEVLKQLIRFLCTIGYLTPIEMPL